ncbi:hypothetical protein ACFYL0_23630, partial [Nocardiopsis alba]
MLFSIRPRVGRRSDPGRTPRGAPGTTSRARALAVSAATVLALTGCAGGTEIQTGGEEDRFISGDGSATVFEAG